MRSTYCHLVECLLVENVAGLPFLAACPDRRASLALNILWCQSVSRNGSEVGMAGSLSPLLESLLAEDGVGTVASVVSRSRY